MKKLNNYRIEIDKIDKEIMKLLDERFRISKAIGKYKFLNNLNLEDSIREQEILRKSNEYINSKYIKNIYDRIFINSKDSQAFEYFLIGNKLDYSYSPLIYSNYGIENYNLLEVEEFPNLKELNFKGCNVTNPFKEAAYNICDEVERVAKSTKVVNTIVKEGNKLKGYNTDYFGFKYLLDFYNVNLENKRVAIIGRGSTAKTISLILKESNVKDIIYLVKDNPKDNEIVLSEYLKIKDFEIIINASPYGISPNNIAEPLFSLEEFTNLECLIDVLYNPYRPALLNIDLSGVKRINGLLMLVAGAAKSFELYKGIDYTKNINITYFNLLKELLNISIIGMPYSGKTTLAKNLSKILKKKQVDIDNILEENNQSLEKILQTSPELTFRRLEEDLVIKTSKVNNQVISPGGGIINSKVAMRALKANSLVIFLNTDLDILKSRIDKSRPLIKEVSDLERIYNERINLYYKYSDIIISNNDDLTKIMEKIDEYLSNKWT